MRTRGEARTGRRIHRACATGASSPEVPSPGLQPRLSATPDKPEPPSADLDGLPRRPERVPAAPGWLAHRPSAITGEARRRRRVCGACSAVAIRCARKVGSGRGAAFGDQRTVWRHRHQFGSRPARRDHELAVPNCVWSIDIQHRTPQPVIVTF